MLSSKRKRFFLCRWPRLKSDTKHDTSVSGLPTVVEMFWILLQFDQDPSVSNRDVASDTISLSLLSSNSLKGLSGGCHMGQ